MHFPGGSDGKESILYSTGTHSHCLLVTFNGV